MKQRFAIILSLVLFVALLTSCAGSGGNDSTDGKNVAGNLTDLMVKIYESIDPPVEFVPMDMSFTEKGDDFGKPVEYFIGTASVPFAEGLASEAAIGAIPHSIVLLRMKPDADVEAAKKTIKDDIDPWKWICVGVDPSDVIVDNIGDLVVVILSDRSVEFHDAFKALAR